MNKEFKSFYKTVGGNEGSKCLYPTRLDLYGCGCQHDCDYCYAKSLLNFRGLWNAKEPAVADLEKVKKRIAKLPAGTILRLGGMTDCFMPLERSKRLTLETIRYLNECNIGYLIVTKSDLVAKKEYLDVMDPKLAHIQITVTSTNDEIAWKHEKACKISDRIEAIEILQAMGFDVQIRLSPYIPQFVDIDIINRIKCDKILVEFLRVNGFIKRWFDIDYEPYEVKQSGYRHLPLEIKRELVSRVKEKQITVCEDVTEHYSYWKEHVNFNMNDCCNLRI